MEKKEVLQWHPAFFAGIQIELEEEREYLSFENEHQLGTKPKEIDVLIIKKDGTHPIHKNIGKIFRGHNLIEYKSPADSLNIDDFYKVLDKTKSRKLKFLKEKEDFFKRSQYQLDLLASNND